MTMWPTDEKDLVRWVRASLQPEDDVEVRGLDEVRISAALAGADLEHLTVDATGASLKLRFLRATATGMGPTDAPSPPVETTRRPGTSTLLRLVAAPVRIQGYPLTIDARLLDAPIDWIEYERPVIPGRAETSRTIEIARQGEGMRGFVDASIRADDLGPMLTAVMKPALRSAGVRLRRLDLTLSADGDAGFRITGAARIRWKLLFASARGAARIGVSRDGVLTIRDLDVGSANPIVAIAMRAARRMTRKQIGRTYDLNAGIAADGVRARLHDVRVDVDGDIRVSARIG
ncbi:hypothetical protein [Microbacterium sp. NPDC087589]|uniref:hypothetical protein n=1 Tax=Microbacterium sp. NPDC087589 TaxID=3364191 RepID=UPI0037FD4715